MTLEVSFLKGSGEERFSVKFGSSNKTTVDSNENDKILRKNINKKLDIEREAVSGKKYKKNKK